MNTTKLPSTIQKILAARRKWRVDFILSKVTTQDDMKIVDIGCGVDGRSFDDYIPRNWEITGIDILPTERVKHKHPNFTYEKQNAQDLSHYEDNTFDLAVSIGMLEHITEETIFNNIVSEIARVAKQYIVVVPYKYCWVEPHYGIPFFPLFPYPAKQFIVKVLNLSNHRKALIDDPEFINKNFRWLSNTEYHKKFPDSKIHLLPTLETIAITRNYHL